MEVYLVTVLLHPTKKEAEDGAVPVIVVPGTTVIAKDEASAGAKAHRLVPSEHADKEDRLDVRILPFRRAAR